MDGSIPAIRGLGWAMLAATLVFVIAAFITKYFGRFHLPSDPLEQLTLIATDPFGWPAQAIPFPLCHLAVMVVFGLMGAALTLGGVLPTLGWVIVGLAAHFGVVGEVTVKKTCVDSRLQWGQAKNVWHNAIIRTGLHLPVRMVQRIFGRAA